jgi:hypothetical protein
VEIGGRRGTVEEGARGGAVGRRGGGKEDILAWGRRPILDRKVIPHDPRGLNTKLPRRTAYRSLCNFIGRERYSVYKIFEKSYVMNFDQVYRENNLYVQYKMYTI